MCEDGFVPSQNNNQRREPLGALPRLGHEALSALYNELAAEHKKHLEAKGVRLPRFIGRDGLYNRTALALIGLYTRKGQPVTKPELRAFVGLYRDGADDIQNGRHLGAQSGWHILSSHRGDIGTEDWPKSSYGLISTSETYPGFSRRRDVELTDDEWENLKSSFGHRCSLCGSREGEPNLRAPAARTKLHKGHRDPSKPLTSGNCLPQCQECNRTLQDRFTYDDRGRPKAIFEPAVILQSSLDIQKSVLQILKAKFE